MVFEAIFSVHPCISVRQLLGWGHLIKKRVVSSTYHENCDDSHKHNKNVANMRAGASGLHDVCRQHTAASTGSTASKDNSAGCYSSPVFALVGLPSVLRRTSRRAIIRISCRGAAARGLHTVSTVGRRSLSTVAFTNGPTATS